MEQPIAAPVIPPIPAPRSAATRGSLPVAVPTMAPRIAPEPAPTIVPPAVFESCCWPVYGLTVLQAARERAAKPATRTLDFIDLPPGGHLFRSFWAENAAAR